MIFSYNMFFQSERLGVEYSKSHLQSTGVFAVSGYHFKYWDVNVLATISTFIALFTYYQGS